MIENIYIQYPLLCPHSIRFLPLVSFSGAKKGEISEGYETCGGENRILDELMSHLISSEIDFTEFYRIDFTEFYRI